ncbi:unnamed protein product [Clonostachys solani]|uniref:Zn(2)-C6 fungal-type domain-containing protein n=1 Tax=Clonostachys solani TaxID=160281 RepID=A0A9N9Z849_9HYPO|nr:unnamed protein product [Clonostachys solani]
MSRKRSLGASRCAAPERPPVDLPDATRSPSAGHQTNGDDETDQVAQVNPHKRRRIPRACDDCRRKKIKCDGRQPCSSCAEFNAGCTYQIPPKRSKTSLRRPQPDTTDDIKARLELAESLIRKFLPQIDLQTLGSTAGQSLQGRHTRDDVSGSGQASTAEPPAESDKYIPLIQNEDQLRFTDNGELDFHGTSSSATFLSRITQNLPELLRYDSRIPFLPQLPRPGGPSTGVCSPFPGHSKYDYSKLPPRHLARMLCDYSFNHASCLLRIVHVPSFYKSFDTLYNSEKTQYTSEEGRFVGLLYSILALGSMYDVDENDPSNPDHYNEATTRGYKYYLGARFFLPDLTECPDMTSLQALLFIIQFLQAIGNLNCCYNLIGVALRTALRMGLHRNLPNLCTTPIESETRKRVFHTIRQLDIYLSATLGLPILLQARDIDQPLPTAIDDEDIIQDTLHSPPLEKLSIIQAFNAHVRLMEILATVVEHVYPPTATSRTATHTTYLIDCGQIREVEQKLHDWYHDLPAIWRPGQDNDVQLIRVQILLRFAFAHVQMMLYRPFLQFFNQQEHLGNPPDQRHRAFATTGITVCRNIVSIGLEIRKQAALLGPYWFILYTQFLAVLCLVSYVSNNPRKPESSEILADAVAGRELISSLSLRSLAADRLSIALNVRVPSLVTERALTDLYQAVFEQLPSRLGSTPPTTKNTIRRSSHASVDVFSPGPSLSNLSNDWQLSSASTPRLAAIREGITTNPNEPTTQASSSEVTPPSLIPADRLLFSFDDPVAYPSTTAWSESLDPAAGLRDETMHLVIPDFFGDLTGHDAEPSVADQSGNSGAASHPASALLSMGSGGLLSDYMANLF